MKVLIFLSFFIASSVWAVPCGMQGSIDERVKECNLAKGEFVLVARNDKGLEIYKDQKTGIIWGDRITTDFNHYGSQMACSHDLPDAELLKDVSWRLPTIHEFEVASSHGMKELPHMEHGFWTSSPVKVKRRRRSTPLMVFMWDGIEQHSATGDLKDAASVRCIGKTH